MRPSVRSLNIVKLASSRAHESLGFIGLGRMGREMAFNLFSKRYALEPSTRFTVCDAVPKAAEDFCANIQRQFTGINIEVASTPSELASQCGTIVTMLPSSPEVRKVYVEDSGILQGLTAVSTGAETTLCIDSTTLDVTVARAVASEIIGAGAEMIDAPVSGGVAGAKAGTLSFMCGGTESGIARGELLLSLMGSRVTHVGPCGAGLGAKLVNNLVLGAQQMIVAEGMLLGTKALGIDPAVLAQVLNTSTGACWSSSVNNPCPGALPDKSPPCEREYEGGFAMTLMLKDLKLAAQLGKAGRVRLPLGEASLSIYERMLERDGKLSRKDFSATFDYLSSHDDV